MAFNPMQLIKLKEKLNAFRSRHPGFTGFVGALTRNNVPEGAVLDMKITYPDGKVMTTNFRVTQEDIEFLRMLNEIRK